MGTFLTIPRTQYSAPNVCLVRSRGRPDHRALVFNDANCRRAPDGAGSDRRGLLHALLGQPQVGDRSPAIALYRHGSASRRCCPVGAEPPGAGSSVTMMARTASKGTGTVALTQARPLGSTAKVPPETTGCRSDRANHIW